MPKYTVTRPEVYLCFVEVEAESSEEALRFVQTGVDEGKEEGELDYDSMLDASDLRWDVILVEEEK